MTVFGIATLVRLSTERTGAMSLGGSQTDGLRKAGCVLGRETVQAFLVEDDWNAEPRFFEEELLDGVGELSHPPRVETQLRRGRWPAGIAWTANLPDTISFFEGGVCFEIVKIAFGVHQLLRLLLPHAHHLRRLLLQRHPRKQIFDPDLSWFFPVLVNRKL